VFLPVHPLAVGTAVVDSLAPGAPQHLLGCITDTVVVADAAPDAAEDACLDDAGTATATLCTAAMNSYVAASRMTVIDRARGRSRG
jgi:hypothetical protein